jgi:hypothetical protein
MLDAHLAAMTVDMRALTDTLAARNDELGSEMRRVLQNQIAVNRAVMDRITSIERAIVDLICRSRR